MDALRAMTLNLWLDQPPLERRLARVVEACRALRPDVLALQEVRQVPEAVPNTAETIARELGWNHAFAVATPWGGGDEGLAILSPLPILRHEAHGLPHATESERRIVLGAAIETPRGEVAVFTTHLNYRLADGAKREDQAVAVDAFAASWGPAATPKLLMGDFNAVPGSDEIRFLRGLHTAGGRRTYWQDAWERLHPDEKGFTWARKNPYTARLGFLDPDRRLDYVFVSPLFRDGRGE